MVLDTRPATHIRRRPHSRIGDIPLSGQFASWAGALLGLETDLVLVAEDAERAAEARMRLARVGIERVTGYLAGGIEAWKAPDDRWSS